MNFRPHHLNSEFGIRNSEFPDSTRRTLHSARRTPHLNRAFTLIELLVVISIIGILAAIGLPAMRGMTRSNAMVAANRQFVDDLAYARQRAIGDHTTVYVVFIPPTITSINTNTFKPPLIPQALYQQYRNLLTGQFTTYALFSLRQLGEQPGRITPKYLTGWRTLPNGVFIAGSKFGGLPAPPPPLSPPFPTNMFTFPFPAVSPYQLNLVLPYIAFNYQGQLVVLNNQNNEVLDFDEYIPLARGSIFFDPTNFTADVQENPAGNSIGSASNVVYINSLTGRAKVLQAQIQ